MADSKNTSPEVERDPTSATLAAGPPAAPAERERWAVPGHEVEAVLGRGGFGVVLAARRLPGAEPVAIKVARGDAAAAREQLEREAQALRAVGPPAAPALLGTGVLDDGSPFLVLERIELPTLQNRLAAGAPLPRAELACRALAVVDALGAVHAAGWAHCDLKPANVFVAEDPEEARLFDFGLAQPLDDPGAPPAEWARTFAGTAEYMAPEQCEGRERPDARTDVYAAGVVLYQMLTGRPPFTGAAAAVQQAHLNLRPQRPSELASVSAALEQVVLRCLAKERGGRYGDAFLLRAALAAALARDAVAATPSPVAAPAAAPPAQERRPVAVLYLQSSADALEVQSAAAACAGQIAHAGRGRYAVVFDAGADENPLRLALRGASRFVSRGLAARALVDLVAATVQRRPGEPPRYLAPAFAHQESYPAEGDPPGPLATARAAELLSEAGFAPAGREGILRCLPEAASAEEPTVIEQRAAPLVGRESLLAELRDAASSALRHRAPALSAVVGEAGMGKSRLAAELARALRRLELRPEVLEVRAREAAGEEGATLRALLRWALRLPVAPAAAPEGRGRALISAALPEGLGPEAWSAVALAMGWLPPDAPELHGAGAAPGALRALALRAAGEALRRRAQAQPCCILIDDAHLADGAALDALEYASLAEGGVPLFVCAFGRPALRDARPAWGERAAGCLTLQLGALEPAAAAELCRQLLLPAESVPEKAVERLVARSRGVPLLLVELVRGLKRDGLVRRSESGAWHLATDELERMPDLPFLDWLADRELGALSEDLAAHARLAALLGDEFTVGELAGVLGELEKSGLAGAFPHDAAAGTRRLLSRGLLVAHRGERFGFRSPLLGEAVARSVPASLQRSIHEAACHFYRAAFALPESARLPRLARHAEACGLGAEAAGIALELAQGMRARHAYLEAEMLFSRALALLPPGDGPGRLAALRGRGLMRYRVGRYEDTIADLVEARALARRLGDVEAELESLLDEATALDWMSDYARSAARVEEARALAGPAPTPMVAARLALGDGRALFRASRWPEACAALEDAAMRAKPLGDAGYETLIIALLLLEVVLPNLGRAEEAEAVVAQALELCRDRGDTLHQAALVNNRRNLLVARGDLAGALADLRDFMRIGRDLGMVNIEYFGEYNLGELQYQAGDLEAAEPFVLRAVEIERQHPEVAARPVAALLWARLLAARGDDAAARQRLAEVRAEVERARAAGRAGAELSPSEEVLAEMVDLATRRAPEPEWRALAARSRAHSVEQEPIEVQEMQGLAALRAGRTEEAERALRAALRLATSIPNVMEGRIRRSLARVKAP